MLPQELRDQRIKIDDLFHQLEEAVYIMDRINSLVDVFPEDVHKDYEDEIEKNRLEIDKLLNDVKVSLEEYFKFEKSNNLPPYLTYRRYYKELKV